MDAVAFRDTIVKPALVILDQWSVPAEMLIMGTAAQESRLRFTRQMGGGPALGYFQMEPATHDDCWTSYINFRPSLRGKVLATRTATNAPRAAEMATDHKYAAAMARIFYMRVPASILASVTDIAAYWKLYYNTPLGAGTIGEFISNWNLLLTPSPYAEVN